MSNKTNYKDFNGSVYIFEYEDEDGNFDYDLYKECQVSLNVAKINSPGPDRRAMKSLYDNVVKKYGKEVIEYGVCHGTRRGSEQRHLRELTGCDQIFGTDISHTANQFDNTIEWDFHEIKEEWVGKFDLVYSNSLDQSYDPVHCLRQWLKTLSPGGICVIHIHGAVPGHVVTDDQIRDMNLSVLDPRLPKSLTKHAGDPFIATKDGYLLVCYSSLVGLKSKYTVHIGKESERECIVVKREKDDFLR